MLLEIQNTDDPSSSFYGKTGHDALLNVIIDLFLAGQETTSSSLVWMFFYLIHHPEVQSYLHKELDEVISSRWFVFMAGLLEFLFSRLWVKTACLVWMIGKICLT